MEDKEKQGKKKGEAVKKRDRCCRTCGEKVLGHVGPCGERCRNKDLMTFDDEPEKDIVYEEGEEEEDVGEQSEEDEGGEEGEESEESKQGDSRGGEKSQKRAKTSTPKPGSDVSIPALEFISSTKETAMILQTLSEQMGRLNSRMEEMEERIKQAVEIVPPTEKEKTIPIYKAKTPERRREGVTPTRQRRGIVIATGELIPDLPEPGWVETPKVIPGLRKVPDTLNLAGLKPHASVPDKIIRSALQGNYCTLDDLLHDGKKKEKEELMETVWVNGKMEVRNKEKKKKIWDVVTWLEAWGAYEHLMTKYHGLPAYQQLHSYKMRIIELNKKYWWSNVQEWDRQVREDKAGESIDFIKYDAADFCFHFDKSTIKQVILKCYKCGDTRHLLEDCPFRKAPGAGAGGRRGLEQERSYEGVKPDPCINFNNKQCYLEYCRKSHVCRKCGGNMPYTDCKHYGQCANAWHQ